MDSSTRRSWRFSPVTRTACARRLRTSSPTSPQNAYVPRRVRIRDGTELEVRPIAPTDAEALRAGFEQLSFESRYERFLSPMDHMSNAMVRYFTDVDHHDHEALVAFDPASERLVAVARYVREDHDPEAAEAAITVADDWHGRGLGTAMLQEIAERAREEGVTRFTAYVLAGNEDMIDILFRLGP